MAGGDTFESSKGKVKNGTRRKGLHARVYGAEAGI